MYGSRSDQSTCRATSLQGAIPAQMFDSEGVHCLSASGNPSAELLLMC